MATTMYVGDLEPDLEVTCYDGDTAVDLSTASSVTVVGTLNGAALFSRAATSYTAAGVVTMSWQTTDTDTAGLIAVEVIVTWPSARPQTFRPPTSITLEPRLAT